MKNLRTIAVATCIIGALWCLYLYFDSNAELDKKVFKYLALSLGLLSGAASKIGKD
jgi:hypothetical protein